MFIIGFAKAEIIPRSISKWRRGDFDFLSPEVVYFPLFETWPKLGLKTPWCHVDALSSEDSRVIPAVLWYHGCWSLRWGVLLARVSVRSCWTSLRSCWGHARARPKLMYLKEMGRITWCIMNLVSLLILPLDFLPRSHFEASSPESCSPERLPLWPNSCLIRSGVAASWWMDLSTSVAPKIRSPLRRKSKQRRRGIWRNRKNDSGLVVSGSLLFDLVFWTLLDSSGLSRFVFSKGIGLWF